MGKLSIKIKDEDIKDVAYVKKMMEYSAMMPGFIERLQENTRKTLDEIGIPLDEREVSFLPNTQTPEGNVQMHAAFPGTAAEKYADFMQQKVMSRDEIKEMCA